MAEKVSPSGYNLLPGIILRIKIILVMNAQVDSFSNSNAFSKPAVYQIKVQGSIDQSWSARLGDMQIRVIHNPESKPVSVLVGNIQDQSALSGILNSLYDLHLTVLTVKVLKELDEN